MSKLQQYLLVLTLFLGIFSGLQASQETGCLYSEDHCASTSWDQKVIGGKVIHHISITANVITFTLKDRKHDRELYTGLKLALDEFSLLRDPFALHENEFAHEHVFHPTHSRNHMHIPVFRELFRRFPSIFENFPQLEDQLYRMRILGSISLEKFRNEFRITPEIFEGVLRNIEREIPKEQLSQMVEDFKKWDGSQSRNSYRVLSSSITDRMMRESVLGAAKNFGACIVIMGIGYLNYLYWPR